MGETETQEGIDKIDEILSVPGISGIYIGPSDMGLSLGLIPTLDREEPLILGIYEKLLASCKKHGKFAGIHNGTAAYAARMIGMGFRFLVPPSEGARVSLDSGPLWVWDIDIGAELGF